jgi:hypothetical protein
MEFILTFTANTSTQGGMKVTLTQAEIAGVTFPFLLHSKRLTCEVANEWLFTRYSSSILYVI